MIEKYKDQPTAWPTRKMMAVLIAGAVVIAAEVALQAWAPGVPVTEFLASIDMVVQLLVMGAAGYMTRERD